MAFSTQNAVSETVGNQVLYRANRNCPVFEELASIFRKTSGTTDVLASALASFLDRIVAAFVFASASSIKELSPSERNALNYCATWRRSGEMRYSFPRVTGMQLERLCTFFHCPECGNRSRRVLLSRQRVVQRILIGELVACLYKAGTRGCKEAC